LNPSLDKGREKRGGEGKGKGKVEGKGHSGTSFSPLRALDAHIDKQDKMHYSSSYTTGSPVSSSSGVWGRAPAANAFLAHFGA